MTEILAGARICRRGKERECRDVKELGGGVMEIVVLAQLYTFSKTQQTAGTLRTSHTACESHLDKDDLK